MSEINVSVGGGPGVVVSVAGDGTTATVTTGGTVNVTLTESNPTWGGIAGKPTTFPPQAHSHAIGDVTGLQAALNQKVELDGNGKVPASQLPSFVDDVVEFANLAALPATGETGKIYVTTNNGSVYRWSGTTYIEISAAPGSTDFVPEGTGNLYHTTARAAAAAPVQSVAGRTGAVTLVKADVGLGNVDNTTDASKPVSTAQAAADAAVASAAAADATSKAAAAQAAAVQRANHTGTQAASTISDFTAAVVAAAPPTTDASLLTTGTLSASRLPNTTVAAGSYGSASSVATFTVDAAGRLTAAGSTSIAIAAGAVSGLAAIATSGSAGDLASGTVPIARLPVGTSSTSVAAGNDARLSDTRTPTAGSVTDASITSGGLSASSINWVAITPWAANTAYNKGDLVSFQGIAYRRSAAGTSGATFNVAMWQQITPSEFVGSQITSGTVAAARLGSGTPSASNFLRGDGTWATAGSSSASDLTSGTLANDRLTTRQRASTNLYLWSSFR